MPVPLAVPVIEHLPIAGSTLVLFLRPIHIPMAPAADISAKTEDCSYNNVRRRGGENPLRVDRHS